MTYLLDTVTIIRHFTAIGKVGKRARQILLSIEANESYGVISVISMMEVLYLAEKKRINVSFRQLRKLIENSSNYFIVDLTMDILEKAMDIRFHELHDRLILATAFYLNLPIISSDKQIKDQSDIQVIWN